MEYACPDSVERSADKFDESDFEELAALAASDLAAFVTRNPRHATLPRRVLLVALCQGAALHHLDGTNGVKDFDVWTFFADDGVGPRYPVRRIGNARYEGPRFDSSTRRVDLLGRTLPVATDADPVAAVQAYLAAPKTRTAWCLAQKPVVMLAPAGMAGTVIWSGTPPL